MFLVPFLFGAILAKVYSRFQRGRLSPFVYSVLVICLIRIFFESIAKWPEALVVLLTAVLLDHLGGQIPVSRFPKIKIDSRREI